MRCVRWRAITPREVAIAAIVVDLMNSLAK